jgi:hypothetical protein
MVFFFSSLLDQKIGIFCISFPLRGKTKSAIDMNVKQTVILLSGSKQGALWYRMQFNQPPPSFHHPLRSMVPGGPPHHHQFSPSAGGPVYPHGVQQQQPPLARPDQQLHERHERNSGPGDLHDHNKQVLGQHDQQQQQQPMGMTQYDRSGSIAGQRTAPPGRPSWRKGEQCLAKYWEVSTPWILIFTLSLTLYSTLPLGKASPEVIQNF